MLRQLTVEKHFTAETLAKRLDVDVDTVWKWVREGKLRRRKLGGKCTRFPASWVNRFLKEHDV